MADLKVLKVLRGSRGRIMAAVMGGIIPRGGAYRPGASDCDLLPRAEAFIMSMNPLVRFGFPFLLYYLQVGAILRAGRPLTRLTEEAASAYLERFEESRLYYRRMIILALKMIAMIAFYDIDENAALIGYEHLGHVREARGARAPEAKRSAPDRRTAAGRHRTHHG